MLTRARHLIALLLLAFVSSAAYAAPPLTTKDCVNCHNAAPTEVQKAEAVSRYVNANLFQSSVHAAFGCTSCHSDVKAFPHIPKPQKVACLNCHNGPAKDFSQSIHAAQWNVPNLKYSACLECHGNPHGILAKTNSRSPVYPLTLPRTCGRCHGNPALAARYGISNVFALYVDSIHGFALTRDGLLVAASCASCHGAHRILSPKDPASQTHRTNIPATCGACHAGVQALYFEGVHGKALKAGSAAAPVCTDCHSVHQIARIQTAAWQTGTVATCGNCHAKRLRSYRDTFHGHVTALGFEASARCWSCHESHRILPPSDPRSSIAPQNLTTTCGKCHQGVTKSFVSFEPHPDPHDRALNPTLYYAALFMNLLLLAVFEFFGVHTLLWLGRSWFARGQSSVGPATTYYFRFSLGQRYLHGLAIVTFLGLAATGMALHFSDTRWAKHIADAVGGFRAVLFIHKLSAVLVTAGFLYHIGLVLYRGIVKNELSMFWGPRSLVPQPKDLADLYQNFKWFLWLGPKPNFDRFTYWEKFDYWAVFWGMAIIGLSGYMMWFTSFFARFVPGYMLNVALLVHSEEALLAVWFIFAIHFFNTHLRVEKFPMDPVIFTGRLSAEELRHDRALEYQRLAEHDELKLIEADKPPRWLRNFAGIITVVTLGIGFFLLIVTLVAYFAGR